MAGSLLDAGMASSSKGSQLARQMLELGPAATQDSSAFSSLLKQCCKGTAISEQDAAEVLAMMTQTQHAAAQSSSGSRQGSGGGGALEGAAGGQQSVLAKTLAALIAGPSSAGGGQPSKDGKGGSKGSRQGQQQQESPQESADKTQAQLLSSASGWNWRTVMDVLRDSAGPGFSWARVADLLDTPGFSVPDFSGFALLATAYRNATGGERLPPRAFCGRVWDNHAGQLSFLRFAVTADPTLFSFQGCPRMAPPLEGLEQAGKAPHGTPNWAWLSIDLLQVLCYLFVEPAHQPTIRAMLQSALKECPEVLLVSMAAVPPMEWSLLQREVFSLLLPFHLSSKSPVSQAVLRRLWAGSPGLVVEALVEYVAQDAGNLPRVLDICQDLQALTGVLATAPYAFSLELAVLASSRGLLDLEHWATDLMTQDAVHFVTALLAFMDVRIAPEQPPGQVPLSEPCVRALLRALQPMRGQIPGDVGQLLKKVQEQVVRRFPALTPLVSGNDPFASDVEEEANLHFQKIYSEQEPIEEVVQLLKSFKSSNNVHEQEVFACMIHNLFDEYRFFPRYPDKELHITALLFGALVGHQLVSSITLGMALRYVQEALAKPPGSKMYAFGTVALRQFVGIVYLWPQFCSRILQIPHFRKMDSDLYACVQLSLRDHGMPVPGLPEENGPQDAASAMASGPRGSLSNLPPGIPTNAGAQQQAATGGMAPTTAAAAAARAIEAPNLTGPYQAWLAGGRGGAPGAPMPTSALMQAHSAAAAGNGAAVGGVTAPIPQGPNADSTGSGSRSKMQSLGDGEGADQAGRALADEVAASSLQPSSAKDNIGGNARPPTLAALVTTESLESAAEKADKGKAPPESVQDRVHFLINNLTEDTVGLRAQEIKAKVVPEFMEWFANYLVVKRAAQEANYHRLYIALVDKVSDKELMRLLSRTTHYYVHVLLHSERIVKESNDRALLKNLGVWLGLLTLARNKPILSKELELKSVVIDAYQRGRLIAVLPFITKLLECCKGSKIFTPSNPMIAGILSLLAELHGMKGLKINNVFSIELVFKAFDVSVQDVKPTDLLRHLIRERLQNQDWSVDALPPQEAPQTPTRPTAPLHAPMAGTPPQAAAGTPYARTPIAASQAPAAAMAASPGSLPPGVLAAMAGVHPQHRAASPQPVMPGLRPDSATPSGRPSLEVPAAAAVGADAAGMVPAAVAPGLSGAPMPPGLSEASGLLAQLPSYVVINPSLAALSERLGLKRLVPLAVERGVQEILAPVVERSVTIACYTAVELVVKDFAVDPDETRMRSAAHLMVSSLAGSLALVTCKDPLRIALANHLRALLASMQASMMDAGVVEQVVGVVVADNLDLGCIVIERAATDKAVRDVDKLLAGAYEERAKARAQGKHFADDTAGQGRFPRDLPESLRPRPGMVTPLQLRVYDDFKHIPRTPPPVPPAQVPAATAPAVAPRPFGGPYAEGGAAVPAVPGADGMPAVFKAAEPTSVASAVFLEQYLVWQGHVDAALASAEATAVAASAASSTAGGAAAAAAASQRASAEDAALTGLLRELVDAVTSVGVHEEAAHFFAHRIFRHLFEVAAAASPLGAKRACSFYVSCLRHLVEILGSKGVVLNMTASWLAMDDERKYNKDAVEALLRARLLSLADLDAHLSKMLTIMRSFVVADLIGHIAKVCLLRDKVVSFQDLAASLDALARFANAARVPPGLAASGAPPAAGGPPPGVAAPGMLPPGIAESHLTLVEQARKVGALELVPNRPISELPLAVRERSTEHVAQREQSRALFEEWMRLLATFPGAVVAAQQPSAAGSVNEADRTAMATFVTALRASGAMSSDEGAERFMRATLEYAVAHTQGIRDSTAQAGRMVESSITYMAIDALARLVVLCVTQAVPGSGQALLSRLLAVMVGCVKREADEKTMAFDGRPYLRFIVGVSAELGGIVGEDGSETASIGYLRAIAVALHMLQPLSVPGFALCWLEAISHRAVMPRLLRSPQAQGWALYEGLLVALLRFMEPYLRVAELSTAMRAMYTGTLRLLLVLLHDFPEFLSEHHFLLCNNIPPTCVQMRNLILSAFPRNMRLPDPFTPNLKVDLLPEISVPPRVPAADRLLPEGLKRQVDQYLRTRQPRTLLQDLVHSITLPPSEVAAAGTHYSVHLINGLVLYIGTVVHPSALPLNGPAMDIYLHLTNETNSEARYLVINAIANQLRFPNSHTHFFSCVLLALFMDSKTEAVREQITRVLLERLIVNRPHPWGLLITFIELIKNPRYNFWVHDFTRCAPDIERLFKSVASSCMASSGGPPGAPVAPTSAPMANGPDDAVVNAAAAAAAAAAAGGQGMVPPGAAGPLARDAAAAAARTR